MEPLTNIRQASLEERINLILHTPELELDGNAYIGKYELGNWKSVESWMKENLLRKKFLNHDTGESLQITTKGMDKLIHHSKNDDAYKKSICHIPAIIENMKFFEKEGNEKLNGKFDSYEYFLTPVKIDGNDYTILSIVGKNKEGFYYDQSVMEGKARDLINKRRDLLLQEHTQQKKADDLANPSNSKYNRFFRILQGLYEKK